MSVLSMRGAIKSGVSSAPGETVRKLYSNQWHPNGSARFREIRGIRGQENRHEFDELTRIKFFTASEEFTAA